VAENLNAHQLTNWIPIRIYWSDRRPLVDWCWIGTRRFAEPFLDHTIDIALRLPFSTLFRPQTPMELLGERYTIEPGLLPRGMIFHMSRCGSTLMSQMLTALPTSLVISEAGSIDSVLRSRFIEPAITDQTRTEWLRWLVSALSQRRIGNEQHLFIKFDSWATLDLPVINTAFPGVPWIFLYRNPVDVLVSQLAKRGAHMIPEAIEPALFGMTAVEVLEMLPEEYCARILARICEAALDYHEICPGVMINYEQMPDVVWTTLADIFGIEISDSEVESLRRITRVNAKNPELIFENDSERKRNKATKEIQAAAERWLWPVFERLEATRLARS